LEASSAFVEQAAVRRIEGRKPTDPAQASAATRRKPSKIAALHKSKEASMGKHRSARAGVLDWWQTVVDETKDLIDDGIDSLRDSDAKDERSDDVAELKKAVANLNAKLDKLVAEKR
jgi:hypothetical protein